MRKVAVVMGSDSDLKVMQGAIDMLKSFGVPFCVRVLSAHRTPDAAGAFAMSAREDGYGAIIAGAGKAAHLAGALASHTTLPVIGVPIKSSTLDGLDALLSTVQMPQGMPVATVAIDGAANAALLAVQMLSLEDQDLQGRLNHFRTVQTAKVLAKDAEIEAQYCDNETGGKTNGKDHAAL